MTSLLLDTHAFVWAVSAPDRLSTRARTAIEDPRNQLMVSSATAWELATKFRLGRFPEVEMVVRQFPSVLEQLGAAQLPIDADHAIRAGGFDWAHRDPFDRMLAAQALIANMPLVTRDRAFADLPGLTLEW